MRVSWDCSTHVSRNSHILGGKRRTKLFQILNKKGKVLVKFIHDSVIVKVKVTLQQATKVQRWSTGIALLFP